MATRDDALNRHRQHLDEESTILGGDRDVGGSGGNGSEGDGDFHGGSLNVRAVQVGLSFLYAISIRPSARDNPQTLTRSGVTPRGVMACELLLRTGRGAWRIWAAVGPA